ncbi:probable galacturonosyltransferase 7 isoform X2 [Tanacetum coccineum]
MVGGDPLFIGAENCQSVNGDEEYEEVFKKDFGESDEEVQRENDVSRVSDTDVEEENPKSKDGVVSSEQNESHESSRKGGSIFMLMDELVKALCAGSEEECRRGFLKLSTGNLTWSFRRAPKADEQRSLTDLTTYRGKVLVHGVTPDRWSVSKPWKSFIDSSEFIKGYGPRHTQPHSHILTYRVNYVADELKYIRLVDDDIETFKVQQQELAPFVVSTLLKQFSVYKVVGACHGLLCLFGLHRGYKKWMVVIWNPSIGKSFGIALPKYNPRIHFQNVFGFGVCPVIRDPTVVNILCADNMPWHVEVFTLSSGVWNVIPTGNLPRQSIELKKPPTQVVIDRFIYWGAHEDTFTEHGRYKKNHMVVSFDLTDKKFKVVDFPNSLTKDWFLLVSVSKLRGSLVVSGYFKVEKAFNCGVWVMEHDSSFRKLFTIGAPTHRILGFKKSGEPIFENPNEDGLYVYDPCSQQIKNLGISGSDKPDKRPSMLDVVRELEHILEKMSERDTTETQP